MSEPRGKIRRTDHFLELIPSYWEVEGEKYHHSRKGLVINGDIRLSQTAMTTFGFFRFRIRLNLNKTDTVQFQLITQDEVASLTMNKDETMYLLQDTLHKTVQTQQEVTVQWILNDERFSLQLIGTGITTLASRQPCASFYDQPFVVRISTQFQHESTLTLLESDYEFVNE